MRETTYKLEVQVSIAFMYYISKLRILEERNIVEGTSFYLYTLRNCNTELPLRI